MSGRYCVFFSVAPPTRHSDGPLLALQSRAGHRRFTHTGHVHSTHLELVEDVLLEVLSLQQTHADDAE